jgi:hypothetical protein
VISRVSHIEGEQLGGVILPSSLYLLAQDAPTGLPQEDKNEVLWLLRAYDGHNARLHLLAETVEELPVVPPAKSGVLDRMVRSIANLSVRLVRSPHVADIVSSGFIVYALLFTGVMVFGIVQVGQLVASKLTQDVVLVGLLVSSVVSSTMIVIGVLLLPRAPLQAYSWFKRAILRPGQAPWPPLPEATKNSILA